jgi:hypothetical protein
MTNAKSRKSKAARREEAAVKNREQLRRDQERDIQQDLMQNVQTASHDSERFGVKWPPSYRTLKKRKAALKTAQRDCK